MQFLFRFRFLLFHILAWSTARFVYTEFFTPYRYVDSLLLLHLQSHALTLICFNRIPVRVHISPEMASQKKDNVSKT